MENSSIDKRNEIIGLIKKLILIVFYFLVMFVFADILADWIKNTFPDINPYLMTILFQYIIYVPILILGIFMLTKDIKKDYKKIYKMRPLSFLAFFGVGLIACYAGNYFGTMISMLIDPLSETSANQNAIQELFLTKYGPLMILDVCIIGPVVEELVFRGSIQKGLLKLNIKPWVAILITSITFGFIHVIDAGDYSQVFPYIFMGISLGYVAYKSKNLISSTAIHITINTIASSIIIVQGILQELGLTNMNVIEILEKII